MKVPGKLFLIHLTNEIETFQESISVSTLRLKVKYLRGQPDVELIALVGGENRAISFLSSPDDNRYFD